jgi:hypothetical protein
MSAHADAQRFGLVSQFSVLRLLPTNRKQMKNNRTHNTVHI